MKSPTETGGPVTKCFEISQAWERHNFPINEGPWMLKLNGVYQLMYSGSDGQSIYYSIGLATAPSPIGPFLKYQNNPIFSGLPDIYCTGHGSVEYDKSGQLWHLYHQKPDTTIGWIRDICLDKVGFDEQGLLKGTPTRGKTQPAPIMTENLVWIPSFNPRGAIFTETTTVSLACRTEGSEIYYTSDGSTPTKASTVFQKPFTLRGNTILKARAFKNGMDASSVATEIFKRCESPLVENPSPNGISIEPGFDIFPQSTLDWKKLKHH